VESHAIKKRIDADGFLADIDVSSIDDVRAPKSDPSQDINHFFGEVYSTKRPDGRIQRRRICAACPG
jgi:hypothetical protein